MNYYIQQYLYNYLRFGYTIDDCEKIFTELQNNGVWFETVKLKNNYCLYYNLSASTPIEPQDQIIVNPFSWHHRIYPLGFYYVADDKKSIRGGIIYNNEIERFIKCNNHTLYFTAVNLTAEKNFVTEAKILLGMLRSKNPYFDMFRGAALNELHNNYEKRFNKFEAENNILSISDIKNVLRSS